ncbi:MAG: insulinase family protein, partial [Elusimicrobia bacterium]|nr:insulinase family protein [Elusimicrobiota bacterium]
MSGFIPKVPFRTIILKNGLRVITVKDHSAPVVSVAVTYNVGSRSEKKGRSGFAHLFEHMMFDNQKDVVREERRWSYDNKPYATALAEEFPRLIFDKWENQHSVIGSMEDLNAAALGDIQEFYRTFYAPNNAVLTVIGDVKAGDVEKSARKYFEKISSQPAPRRPDLNEPFGEEPRQSIYKDRFAALPVVAAGWKAPLRTSPDYKALALLGSILAEGEDSRLYQLLVKQKEWALGVGGGLGWPIGTAITLHDPASFGLMAHLKPGVSSQEVLDAIDKEIKKIAQDGLTEAEMERVRRKFQAEILDMFQGTETRSYWLGQFTHLNNGDPHGFEEEINSYLTGVTKEMVQKAVQAGYLDAGKRRVLLIEPDSGARGSGLHLALDRREVTNEDLTP